MNEDLTNKIVTTYGVQVFPVERAIAEYGAPAVDLAFSKVEALPHPPDSPFGWMISQLRSGRIQVELERTLVGARQSTDRAKRYCEAQHTPGQTTALKELMGEKGECSVCGQLVAL